MTHTFTKSTCYLILSFMLMAISSCAPDEDELQEATFPRIAEVFIDGFSPGLQYDAFGNSRVTAFDVDTDISFLGSSSMRFDIPNTNDPQGGFAGGIFSDSGGRDLTNFNVLSFYARASRGETIDQVGFGLTFQGEVFRTQVNNLQVGTEWQQYFIPIPNAARLTQESGMLWYAEAADNGESYQLWIDEVRYENLNTILLESAGIFNGQDQVTAAVEGAEITASGGFSTYNLPSGIIQRVDIAPAYFDFSSSNEGVASVNDLGIISVTSSDGLATITGSLGGIDAEGSLMIGMDPLDPSPNVDDSNAQLVSLPVGFESTMLTYDFEGFEGAASSIEPNPAPSDINPTATVMRTTKTVGSQFFAGTLLNLDAPINFSTSEIISIKTWSPKADIPVRMALENQAIGGSSQIVLDINTSTTNEWEELIFNFTGQIDPSINYDRVILFFEFVPELPGDGSTYFYDDIFVIGSDPVNDGDDDMTGGSETNLLSNGDFEQGMTIWEGNGFNVQTDGGNSFNFVDVMAPGNPFDVNLSQRGLSITEGQTYTLTFDASTDTTTGSRSIIAGIGLFVAPFTNEASEINLTDTTQTFSIDLVANFSSTDGRVLFDMGADTGIVVIDNVILTTPEDGGGTSDGNELSNGDFEEGMTVWEGNGFNVQMDGGNSFNFVNVATAGNAFDVNLSQRGLNVTEGQTFTLTFDASTDAATGSRTMIVGIGLFVNPFTNQSSEITITDTTQTFSVDLTANFTSTDGRVLFDMGADTGVVVIDNVILELN